MSAAIDYGVRVCPECHATENLVVAVTGNTRRTLFDWQKAKVRGKAVFGEDRMHQEAELRCESCRRTFWTISPAAISEAMSLVES